MVKKNNLQALVVDPDIQSRDVLVGSLAMIADLEVLGTSPSGKLCIDRMVKNRVAVVIAAAELGDMNIVEFLRQVKAVSPDTCVIVVTKPDNPVQADLAVSALGQGAFDYLEKPDAHLTEKHIPLIHRFLAPKILCFTINRFSSLAKISMPTQGVSQKTASTAMKLPERIPATVPLVAAYRLVLIGVSTGGPQALHAIMPLFPKNFSLPIVIVLHMPKLFTGAMAKDLDARSALSIHEAEDKDVLLPGNAYLAPGGIHLTVENGTRGNFSLRMQESPPENGCKPAVDVLFRSAAQVAKEKCIGIILTGMGIDGTAGARSLREFNVPIIAQDEATSVVWGMPGSVVKAGLATEVMPLLQIPKRIVSMVTG